MISLPLSPKHVPVTSFNQHMPPAAFVNSQVGSNFLSQIPQHYLSAFPPAGSFYSNQPPLSLFGSIYYPVQAALHSLTPALAHVAQDSHVASSENNQSLPAQISYSPAVANGPGSSLDSPQSNLSPSSDISQNRRLEAPSHSRKLVSKRNRPSRAARNATKETLNFTAINYNQTFGSYLNQHIDFLNSKIGTTQIFNWFKKYKEPIQKVYLINKTLRRGEVRYRVAEVGMDGIHQLPLDAFPEASATSLSVEGQPFPRVISQKRFIPTEPIKKLKGAKAVWKMKKNGAVRQVTVLQNFHRENRRLIVQYTENGEVKESRAGSCDLYLDDRNLESFR